MNPHSTSAAPPAPPSPDAHEHAPRHWWRGRSEIFVGLLTIGIGAFLGVQTLTMHVPDTSTGPGPQLFPSLVAVLMTVLGAVLIAQVAWRPAPDPARAPGHEPGAAVGELVDGRRSASGAPATHSDWRTVGIVVGSVVLFTLLLQPVGWLLSGALLFFGVAWAFGGRRPLYEATVALVYSSVVQLAFVAGLGLNLPAGILGGVL